MYNAYTQAAHTDTYTKHTCTGEHKITSTHTQGDKGTDQDLDQIAQ